MAWSSAAVRSMVAAVVACHHQADPAAGSTLAPAWRDWEITVSVPVTWGSTGEYGRKWSAAGFAVPANVVAVWSQSGT
jgi:hypothetical protein